VTLIPLLPALLFVAAPATAIEAWGIPDLGQRDKQQHAAAGAVIGALACAATKSFSPRSTWFSRAVIGVAAAAIAGVAKEAFDAQHPRSHTADPKDALATIAGGTVGVLAIELVWRF
jgi:uncharacterized membrane protein YeaQ/YmgE (transglycosylase-associated protein family)